MKGKLIVLEGGEGSGKTSLAASLSSVYKYKSTREPGGTKLAESIREILMNNQIPDLKTQLMMFMAARRDHLINVVKPCLDSGVSVIMDRYDWSTWAYQVQFLVQAGDMTVSDWSFLKTFYGHIEPDLYIYMIVDPAVGLARRNRQGNKTVYDEKHLDFHIKVAQGLNYSSIKAASNVVLINADLSQVEVLNTAINMIDNQGWK